MNDGAYGAEVHKLRASGVPADEAVFGSPDFAMVARGFGVRAGTARAPGDVTAAVRRFAAQPGPALVDVRVWPTVVSRRYRRMYLGLDV